MPGKLIAIDEHTLHRLKELGRNRMATLQELADEAIADLLKKHNVPVDLKDALRKSVKATGRGMAKPSKAHPRRARRPRHRES